MELKIIEDMKECKLLWEQFSPHESLWDEWFVVESLYDSNIHRSYFLWMEDKGLLPMWYDSLKSQYRFFGGGYPDNRSLWFAPDLFSDFYNGLPPATWLIDISHLSIKQLLDAYPEHADKIKQDDTSYFIDFTKLGHNIDAYLSTFSSKHRKNLKYDLRKLSEAGYRVVWGNDPERIDSLISLNKERFGSNSDLSSSEGEKEFRNLVRVLSEKDLLHTSSVYLDEEIVGVEIGVMFGNTYYLFNGGFSLNHNNVGKLMIFSHIQKAIELKAEKMDFMVGDTGWKSLWNLETSPVYSIRKD